MPVAKFDNPDDARRALWTHAGDPRLLERIRRLWERARRIVPTGGPRGVRKFRTIEEANADRLEWTRRRALALREQRKQEREQ